VTEKGRVEQVAGKTSLRIAINARFLVEGRMEGLGHSCWEIYRRLVETCPQHTFLFFFDRPWARRFVDFPNVIPVALWPPARHYLLWFIWFEISLPRALRKWKADLLFSHSGSGTLSTRVPVFMTIHDLAFLEWPQHIPAMVNRFYRFFTPRHLARAKHVFVVSRFVRDDLIRHYNLQPERISVIYNGLRKVDSRREEQAVQIADSPYFFYYGAIHPRKNLDRVLRAYTRFRSCYPQQVRFIVAGRMAWQTEAVWQAREESPYREDIAFTGYLPDEAVSTTLRGALALVYVSLHEGFGMPIVEAFGAGVPVLTSRTGAMAEIAGQGAVLVNPVDVEDIARGMLQLARDAKLRETLREAGRRELVRFDWDQAVGEILKNLES